MPKRPDIEEAVRVLRESLELAERIKNDGGEYSYARASGSLQAGAEKALEALTGEPTFKRVRRSA